MKDHREKFWFKARQRIIEEVALQMITEQIGSDNEGIRLPRSWINEAEKLRDELVHEIVDEAMTETHNPDQSVKPARKP